MNTSDPSAVLPPSAGEPAIPLDRLLAAAHADPPERIAGYVDRIWVACGLCDILAAAHAAGRIHGDLHPTRILVDGRGGVSITGWAEASPGPVAASPYRAPELSAGGTPGRAADIYAFGAILWELLTLRPPLVVEENLTRFHRRKQAGETDPLPAGTRSTVPEELLAVARQAMAPDPGLRWQDAGEPLTALRGWLRRIESVAITLQAERTLAAAGADAGGPAAGVLRSALALWPGNPAAAADLAGSEAAQALSAIADDDSAAARQHLERTSGAARTAVTAAYRRLQRRHLARRWGTALAAVAIALLLALGLWLWSDRRLQERAWQTEAEWALGRGARTTGLESSLRDVAEHDPVPVPLDEGLDLPPYRIIWLKDVDGRGDVRLSVELEWTSVVDGFEMMVAAPRTQPPSFSMTQPGYACQFGGFRGTQTFLCSSPVAGWPQRPSPVAVPFTTGRMYRLELERQGEHLRLRVDGRVVWDQREVVPVGDSRFRWLALRAWSPVRLRRIQVEKPLLPPPVTPLSTADALAAAGHHADALAAYRAALRGPLSGRLREQAIAKGHLVAARTPGMSEVRRELLLLAERGIAADAPYLLDVLQAEAACLWQGREWKPALRLAERVQQRYPTARCALALLERRIDGIPESVIADLLRLIAHGPPVSHLDLAGLGITDLAPLAGIGQLGSLDISGNRIDSMEPLRGMRLQRLVCSGNRIDSLEPLRGMPLLHLHAAGNRLSSLDPLRDAPLEELHVADNRIADLSPISGLPLQYASFDGNPVASLEPLRRCERLRHLSLADAPLADLSPLPLAQLRRLSVVRCPVRDIVPLAAAQLVQVNLSGTHVSDLGPLPRGQKLHLNLAGCPVDSLASLRGLTLTYLNLSRCPLTDLAGIGEIAFGVQHHLSLDDTPIATLAPLAAPAMGFLSINRTRIRDLSPLAGRSIARLSADGIPADDLAPVAQVLGLQRASFWRTGSPTGLDVLADRCERIAGQPTLAVILHIQAAAAAGDWRRLRAMARRVGAADRLALGIELPFDEALALAGAAGAHLPCFRDAEDLRQLASSPTVADWFWAGLLPRERADLPPRWMDGRMDPFLDRLILPQPDPYQGRRWACPPTPQESLLHPIPDGRTVPRAQTILEW